MSREDDFQIQDVSQLRPRPSQDVTLTIPMDSLTKLEQVAKRRDMSLQALLKFYISMGYQNESNPDTDRTWDEMPRPKQLQHK